MNTPYLLVLYYSKHGAVLNMAKAIAKGSEQAGLEVKIRTVVTAPDEHAEYPLVTIDDLKDCSALALGSPCRFGQMAVPLQAFLQQTSVQWLSGDLIDKPASVFTSSSSMHGGNESTLLSMALPLLHHGMMLLGVPYSEPALHQTDKGGSPYGPTHVSGLSSQPALSDEEKTICNTIGQRLAVTALKLNS